MQYTARGIVSGVGLGLLMLIAACATQLHKAQQMTPEGDAFSRSLASGYLEMAEASYDDGEFSRSETFANKSIQSAQGKPSTPNKPSDYDLNSGSRDLESARVRLMNLLDGSNARVEMPEQVASAQVNYDCWLERRADNDITTPECRNGFEKNMKELTLSDKAPSSKSVPTQESFSITYDLEQDKGFELGRDTMTMNPVYGKGDRRPSSDSSASTSGKQQAQIYHHKPKTTQKTPSKPTSPTTHNQTGGTYRKGLVFDAGKWGNPSKTYTLYFNAGSTSITEEAELILQDIAKELLSNPYKLIRIEGYTDLQGDERANLALSFKRALSADKGLLKAISGKSPSRSIEGKGEKTPVVTGQEGMKSVKNRRVKIMLF